LKFGFIFLLQYNFETTILIQHSVSQI